MVRKFERVCKEPIRGGLDGGIAVRESVRGLFEKVDGVAENCELKEREMRRDEEETGGKGGWNEAVAARSWVEKCNEEGRCVKGVMGGSYPGGRPLEHLSGRFFLLLFSVVPAICVVF